MTAKPKLILGAGGAELLIKFRPRLPESVKDLAPLRWDGQPFPAALTERILAPFLAHWARQPGDRRAQLQPSVDAAMADCLRAFQACAPEQAREEGRAILAALAVTANLQRTLLTLAEALARPKRKRTRRATVVLSREWCGLLPRRHKPVSGTEAAFRPLARALASTPREIEQRCAEALAALRADFTAGRWMGRDDVAGPARRLA
jgi:hypothetical protein